MKKVCIFVGFDDIVGFLLIFKGKDHEVHMKFTNFKTNMLYESKNCIKKINFHF